MTFNSKLSLALMAVGFSVSISAYASAACVTGDCAAMGYNKTESVCSGDIIRCPFDTSKVFCKEETAAQKCLDEGYRLEEDWPKPTASNETVIPSSMLANFMKNIFDLKPALAIPTGNLTTAITDPLKADVDPIGPITGGETGSATIDSYTFIVTATCPYDSNYVKGVWRVMSAPVLCAAHCEACDALNTKCLKCITGYTLSNGRCTNDIVSNCPVSGCQTCVSGSTTKCAVCKANYTLSNGSCLLAAVNPGCTNRVCNGKTYCCPSGGKTPCDSGYDSSGAQMCYTTNDNPMQGE